MRVGISWWKKLFWELKLWQCFKGVERSLSLRWAGSWEEGHAWASHRCHKGTICIVPVLSPNPSIVPTPVLLTFDPILPKGCTSRICILLLQKCHKTFCSRTTMPAGRSQPSCTCWWSSGGPTEQVNLAQGFGWRQEWTWMGEVGRIGRQWAERGNDVSGGWVGRACEGTDLLTVARTKSNPTS